MGATDFTIVISGRMTVTTASASSVTGLPIRPARFGVPVTVAVFVMSSGTDRVADFTTDVVQVYSHSSPCSRRPSPSSPVTNVTGAQVPGPVSSVTTTSWSGTCVGFVAS